MIAVDTNLLVHAHRTDSPWHDRARSGITELAEGRATWGIPWSCLHEYLAVVTHPKIYLPPSTLAEAVSQVEAWLESPTLMLLTESEGYLPFLTSILREGKIAGPKVHDARIAALCLFHGVRELWTADRDFGRFPSLKVRNPLLD